jgi:hypothetical protein
MKKALAAVGASVLGLSGALVATAAPATAATPQCTTSSDHNVSTTADGSQDWYMDCVPQYGLGKAEFTITTTSPKTFPVGYTLDDGHQTVTSSVDGTTAAAYFGEPAEGTGGFLNLTDPGPSTTTSQSYGTSGKTLYAIYPVKTTGKLTSLPQGCFPNTTTPETYAGMYEVTFKPTTTTFTETIGGKTVTTTITTQAAPLDLGLNFSNGQLDGSAPLCAVSGTNVFQADNNSDFTWQFLASDEVTFNPTTHQTLDPGAGSSVDLGSSVSTVASATVTPTKPTLALTGVDARPAGIIGGSLLAIGIGLFAYGRTRRRAAKRQ